MIRAELLNALITGEMLLTDSKQLPLSVLKSRVDEWQAQVQAIVQVPSVYFSQPEQKTLMQLISLTDQLLSHCQQLKMQFNREQKQLLKGNAAAHAYVSVAQEL
jgi:hypothetical protein